MRFLHSLKKFSVRRSNKLKVNDARSNPTDGGDRHLRSPDDSSSTIDSAELFRRLIGSRNTITAVDVGGAGDLQPHWHKLISIGQFIVYEPNKESFDRLVSRQSDTDLFENFRYVNDALAGSDGLRELYITEAPTASSLRPINTQGFAAFAKVKHLRVCKTETVCVKTLTRSSRELDLSEIHVIKLDTQGTEVEILTGIDDALMNKVLAVELEAGLLDHYIGDKTALEDSVKLMRDKGFQLFDMRCSRFHGSALRYGLEEMRVLFNDDIELPPSGHRINEVDLVFFREPRVFILSTPDEVSVRRYIVLLCVYNFFLEAVATVKFAEEVGVFSAADVDDITEIIKSLFLLEKRRIKAHFGNITDPDRWFYAQYMWVPVPST